MDVKSSAAVIIFLIGFPLCALNSASFLIGILKYLFMEHEVVLTVLLPYYMISVTFVSSENNCNFLTFV